MNKNNLSLRLKAIADLVPAKSTVADIGTDHGYLGYALYHQYGIQKLVLSDINKGPLENAKQTFSRVPQKADITFRLGSGLEKLENGEVSTIVIAGMGGALMRQILSKDMEKTKTYDTFILQPQTEQDGFREWLLDTGFHIITERYVYEDHKFYEIILARWEPLENSKTLYPSLVFSEEDFEMGYKMLKDDRETYLAFLAFKLKKYQLILSRLPNKEQAGLIEKKAFCESKIQTLLKRIKEVEAYAD